MESAVAGAIGAMTDSTVGAIAEPLIADYEEFLLEQLAAKPTIGYKLMMKAIRDAKGAIFK